ncbi:MAG: lipopolysaccharide heptosyltransferase II [Planctomycetia bacterium]|nr:lipopolysaccharide heptosyltransferase II [Planctomycetia bacterium]
MKIAIFCPSWVGDMVMATPALRAVRRQFPQAEIVAVVRPYVAGVLDGLDLVDHRLVHDPRPRVLWRGPNAQATAGLPFGLRLRREKIDAALLLTNTFRSAFWALFSGAQRRVGFNLRGRGWMLTDPVAARPLNVPHPVIDNYLQLAGRLGCSRLTRTTELATNPDDERRIREFWARQRVGEHASQGVVCLNPGGAFGAAKHWPTQSFAELAVRIVRDLHKRVLVLCGPAEREAARQIVALSRHPAVVSLAEEELSLGLTKAAIRQADLLVSTDSGPRHFAAPFGVPVVTLFGPTHTAWSETFYERSLHLQADVDCGPCQKRVCPLNHHRCMHDLTVSWVFRATETLLQQFPARPRAA